MKEVFSNKEELIAACIKPGEKVLDIGFSGHGIQEDSLKWPHALLKKSGAEVYGLDLELAPPYDSDERYKAASAEAFSFPLKFDKIFAGDVIEHLSNPGLFLGRCLEHLKPEGQLIITTPNTFNLYNLTEKLSKQEPTVNADHTCYFNSKTLLQLLKKNGFTASAIGYVYSLEYDYSESWKKKIVNTMYSVLSRFTTKFLETLVVVAQPAKV